MSIIYEALRKIEDRINPADNKNIPIKIYHQPKSKKKKYILLGLIIGVCIAAGASLFNISIKSYSNHKAQKQKLKTAKVIETLDNESLKKPKFILNGIFFSQEEAYALINNQIVKEGDMVGGATVRSITVEEVELDNNGLPIKLATAK